MNRPISLTCSVVQQMRARFVTFAACKKSRFELKQGKKVQCVLNWCKDLFERKKYFGVRCTLIAEHDKMRTLISTLTKMDLEKKENNLSQITLHTLLSLQLPTEK